MPPKTEAQALAKRRRLSVLDNGAPSEKIPRFNSNRSLPALSSDPAANGWTPLQGASQANDDVIDISSDSDSEPFVPRLDTSPQTAQVAGSSEVLDLVSDTETEQLPASSEAPPTRKMREATLPRPLKKCRILLDIYTGEGEDAGAEFAEQLRALGADVIRTPRRDLAAPGKLTHIVFKHGRDATLRLFELSDVKPHLVSVLWAEACHLTQARADEDRFPVGTDSAIPLKSYSKASRQRHSLSHNLRRMQPDPSPQNGKIGSKSQEVAKVEAYLNNSLPQVEADLEDVRIRRQSRI